MSDNLYKDFQKYVAFMKIFGYSPMSYTEWKGVTKCSLAK